MDTSAIEKFGYTVEECKDEWPMYNGKSSGYVCTGPRGGTVLLLRYFNDPSRLYALNGKMGRASIKGFSEWVERDGALIPYDRWIGVASAHART